MEKNLKVLQSKILEILVYFDNFCKKNNIIYYLMGGSALGAIRHKGFIPWDDDCDVFMTYDNYVKLIDLMRNKCDERFYFQVENCKEFPYYFCKLKMNNTTFFEDYRYKEGRHYGIFIDIMCLNYVSNNLFNRKMQYYAAGLLKSKALYLNEYKTDSLKKKILIFISCILVNKITKKPLLWFVRKNNKKKSSYLGHYFGRAPFKSSVYSIEWFKSQKFVLFEDVILPVCCGVESYLSCRYGNKYMEIPNQQTKDKYKSHSLYWNTNEDFQKFIKDGKIVVEKN